MYKNEMTVKHDPEHNTEYLELSDGLRLIFRDGLYVGWYTQSPA